MSFIDDIEPDDLVVLELSSFQLELVKNSPHVAAILNITPNHLDRHETMENYTAAKVNILRYQTEDDTAVLFRENDLSWAQKKVLRGGLVSFGFEEPDLPAKRQQPHWWDGWQRPPRNRDRMSGSEEILALL